LTFSPNHSTRLSTCPLPFAFCPRSGMYPHLTAPDPRLSIEQEATSITWIALPTDGRAFASTASSPGTIHRAFGRRLGACSGGRHHVQLQTGVELVEAVGIEPTSGNPQPQASTSIAGLSCCSLALRSSIRQEGREASLIYLALPLRPSSEPATRI